MIKLEAESLTELRRRRSVKWRLFSDDILPLPIAEMDYPIAEPIQRTLIDMIEHSDLGYGGIVPELPLAFAEFAQHLWGWQPDANQIRTAGDVGAAVTEVLRHLLPAHTSVAISSPVYMNFYNWIPESGCELVDVPLDISDNYRLDLDQLERAFQQGVKAYLLCNPQNPVGVVHSKSDLEKLAALANKYQVLVISDEIHGALVYSETDFTPFLSINDDARKVGVSVTSASKTFNLAGLKCALIISQNELMNERLSKLPITLPQSASILGEWAGVTAFTQCSEWHTELIHVLDDNRRFLADLIHESLPRAQYRIPQATYLAWIDLRAYGHADPGAFILEHAGVALSRGVEFGAQASGYVRLNFATRPSTIRQAVEAMAKVLET